MPVALACSTAAIAQAPPSAPPAVTVAKPIVKEVVERDDYVGRFEAVDAVEIRARVSGYLQTVSFRDGAIVKLGDPLFTIDKRPYQAALDQAEAAVTSAQARVAFAQSDYERAAALGRTGNITEQLLEQRRNTLETARGDLLGAQAAARTARLNLGFTEIHAPMAGRIGRKLISEGNLVTADQTLLTTIVSLDPIYFYFDVDERSYLAYERISRNGGSRQTGYEIMVALADETEPKHKGVVDFIDNRVDQATGTMRGRAVLENKDLLLTPGLFGRILIPASDRYKGVLVPDEAIGADLDRRFVYVVAQDGSVSQKVVRPGPRFDGYRIIRSGLTGDETIIVNGTQRARFGKITPQPTELPSVREASATTSRP
jgi:membrane fusion protein, multidrug efflux system